MTRVNEFPIRLKIDPEEDDPLSTLRAIFLASKKGGVVPLSEVVEPLFMEHESNITHVLFQPTVEINFWNHNDFSAHEVASNVLDTLKTVDNPDNITIEIGES